MPELETLHQTIHFQPELSLQEIKAADALCSFLDLKGFMVERGLAGLPTSFRADSGPPAKRPRAAILAEYDALPAIGHACGHSVIAAAAAGAGAALAGLFPKLPASVVGTPAEEAGVGKISMLEAGVFEDIDAAMMVHPSSKRQVVRLFLGVMQVEYVFKGKASHAAAFPEGGVNALDAAVLFYTGMSALRQQLRDEVRVHAIIRDGGKAANIIPERSEISCMVRALDLDVLADAAMKVDACARGAAKATGCRLSIRRPEPLVAPFLVNRELAAIYEENVRALGLEPFYGPEDKNIGSSDVGNLSQALPCIHPHVPISAPHEVAIHTREFEKAAGGKAGKKAVREGAILLALTALEVLTDGPRFKKIVKEFESGKKARGKGLGQAG